MPQAILELKRGISTTSNELAKRLDVSRAALYRYEHDDLKPSVEILFKLLMLSIEAGAPSKILLPFVDRLTEMTPFRRDMVLLPVVCQLSDNSLGVAALTDAANRVAVILADFRSIEHPDPKPEKPVKVAPKKRKIRLL